jgi:hypothetical protein
LLLNLTSRMLLSQPRGFFFLSKDPLLVICITVMLTQNELRGISSCLSTVYFISLGLIFAGTGCSGRRQSETPLPENQRGSTLTRRLLVLSRVAGQSIGEKRPEDLAHP